MTITPDGAAMLNEAMSLVGALQQRVLLLAGENGALRLLLQEYEKDEKVAAIRKPVAAAE